MTGMLSQIRLPVLLDLGENGSGGGRPFSFGARFPPTSPRSVSTPPCPVWSSISAKRPADINKCLRYGTLIALCLLRGVDCGRRRDHLSRAVQASSSPRAAMSGDLIRAAGSGIDSSFILRMLEAFSFFRGGDLVPGGAGLFDYMADLVSSMTPSWAGPKRPS